MCYLDTLQGQRPNINDMRNLLFWSVVPFLLPQALYVRKNAPRFASAGMPPLHRFPLLPQPLRAVFGMRGRALDEVARAVIDSHRQAIHIPLDFEPGPDQFAADGYHPSEESYAEFGRQMADGLLSLGADK